GGPPAASATLLKTHAAADGPASSPSAARQNRPQTTRTGVMVQKRSPGGPTAGTDGDSSRSGPESSQPRRAHGPRRGDAWRTANETFRAARNRLEPTMAGRVCRQLAEIGFINSWLQLPAVFTVGFIPFLMVLSVALGSDLSPAIVIRSGFTVR